MDAFADLDEYGHKNADADADFNNTATDVHPYNNTYTYGNALI